MQLVGLGLASIGGFALGSAAMSLWLNSRRGRLMFKLGADLDCNQCRGSGWRINRQNLTLDRCPCVHGGSL